MKRIYILLLACLGTMSVMAQGQKLKTRIIDKDYYPVDSAKVTLKGTNISAVTDKNGNFVLENVPLVLDSIQIQKGKKDYTAGIPINIEMRTAVMDRFAWYIKAGVEFAGLHDDMNLKDGVGFYAGVGLDMKMSRHWAFQPGVYLSYRKMEGNLYDDLYMADPGDDYGQYYEEEHTIYKMWNIEVPLLLALKYPLGRSLNMQIQFGGYVDVGLGGDITKRYYNNRNNSEIVELSDDIYGKRLTGGFAYGIGFEYGHILFGVAGRTGCSSGSYSESFTSVSLEVGYKF